MLGKLVVSTKLTLRFSKVLTKPVVASVKPVCNLHSSFFLSQENTNDEHKTPARPQNFRNQTPPFSSESEYINFLKTKNDQHAYSYVTLEAITHFQQFPSTTAASLIIAAFLQQKRHHAALEFYESLKDKAILPSTLDYLMKHFNAPQYYETQKMLFDNRISQSKDNVLDAYSLLMDAAPTLEILNDIAASLPKTENGEIHSILRVSLGTNKIRLGQTEEGYDMIMMQSPVSSYFEDAVVMLTRAGKVREAFTVFCMRCAKIKQLGELNTAYTNRGFPVGQSALKLLLTGTAVSGDITLAEQIWTWFSEKETETDPVCYHSIFETYVKGKHYQAAFRTVNTMEQRKIPYTKQVFLPLIDALSENPDTVDTNYYMLLEMKKTEFVSDKCFNIIIDACVRMRDFDRAFETFKEFGSNNITPSVETYDALIYACYQAHQADTAYQLFTELKAAGLTPTIDTYAVLLIAFTWYNSPQKALEALDEMESLGYVPDERHVNKLILKAIHMNDAVLIRKMKETVTKHNIHLKKDFLQKLGLSEPAKRNSQPRQKV